MTISRKVREQMLKLCGSICEEDGQEARDYLKKEKQLKKSQDEHRQRRLCKQVRETLSLVVSSAPSEIVQSIAIHDVVPGKRTTQLVVQIVVEASLSRVGRESLLEQLKSLEGWLRAQVAAAITRKKVPQLSFEIVVDSDQGGDQ